MSLVSELKEKGIDTKLFAIDAFPMQFKCDCPNSYCKKSRPPDDKNPLTVDILTVNYAEWMCRHCLGSGHIGQKPEAKEAVTDEKPVTAPKAPVQMPPEALAFLAAKGMTEEEATKFRLSYDGRSKCIKIPYLEGSHVINHALVRISDGATKLERNDRIQFFGLAQLVMSSVPIIIAQREIDALILRARGFPNVLAIPAGGNITPQADDFDKVPDKFVYLSAAANVAKGWGDIKFALDATKEGLAMRQELARRLGPGRCSAAVLSNGTVSDTMTAPGGADTLCADINEAKKLPIFGLFTVDDFEKELLAYYDYGMAAGVETGWNNIDKLYTVMPGQLTVITGIPNSGKSEWLDALCSNLALNFGWRFAAFSPENGKAAHVMKLVEKRVEMSGDPKSHRRMSRDTLATGAKWVGTHFFFIENMETMPTLEWILDRAKDAALRYGIKGLVIDPWNRIEKKLGDRQSETDYVAESIPKILRFAANYGVHVWLVVHPKQQQKDKSGNIPAPSLYDMAGSAHFVNMCDNGIVIHRGKSIDDTTEVWVNKVRFKHVGTRGKALLRYARETGRYEPIDDELTPKQMAEAEKLAAANNGDDDSVQTYEVD